MREAAASSGFTVPGVYVELMREVARQDEKHGPFEGSVLGRSRLAIACLEDEVAEAKQAWRDERKALTWDETYTEVLQVAAVAVRALRDSFAGGKVATEGASNRV